MSSRKVSQAFPLVGTRQTGKQIAWFFYVGLYLNRQLNTHGSLRLSELNGVQFLAICEWRDGVANARKCTDDATNEDHRYRLYEDHDKTRRGTRYTPYKIYP